MSKDVDSTHVLQTLRLMAWERAKGELYSIGAGSYGAMRDYSRFDELLSEFIEAIESESLIEGV